MIETPRAGAVRALESRAAVIAEIAEIAKNAVDVAADAGDGMSPRTTT